MWIHWAQWTEKDTGNRRRTVKGQAAMIIRMFHGQRNRMRMRRGRGAYLTIPFGLAMLLGSCTQLSTEDLFSVDDRDLETLCLSDDAATRSACTDYIEDLTSSDAYQRDPWVACYHGELLTLHTVSVRGYRQVLEVMEWTKTVDGRAQVAAYPEFVGWGQDFLDSIEPARDAIHDARRSGMRWSCRFGLLLTRRRWYW